MREHQAGRSGAPWRQRLWFKRISNTAAHVSAATLLAAGVANGLAARKHKSGNEHRGQRDHANTDGDGGNDRNRGADSGNDPKEDRGLQREHKHHNPDRGDNHDRHVDASNDLHSAAKTTPTPTPTPTPAPKGNNGGGGGGGGNDHGGGGGGGGDGGHGHRAGNAGSGLFDSSLATKARRRAKDFDNADHDQDHDGTSVDVNPDGDSVYHTGSVTLTTGPDGLEVVTNNITYTAAATPTPEPLPRFELPAHESGISFGKDFPFGNMTAAVAPKAAEPSDPGDTSTASVPRAKPITDGGDNSMDFVS